MSESRTFVVSTATTKLTLIVDEERRLRLQGFGDIDHSASLPLAYPAAGDGWVFEPAISVVHADGNTSTDLRVIDAKYSEHELTVTLKDEVYDCRVALSIRANAETDVFETTARIENREAGEIVVEALASSSFDFGKADWHLTQFRGDWADEANMETERLGAGIKVLDSKLMVRAHQFTSPWFIVSNGPLHETEGEVFGGSLAWPSSFQFVFEKMPKGNLVATCGYNPHGSRFHLQPGEALDAPTMIWAWSGEGSGDLSRKLHRYMRERVIRDGDRLRPILLNNWEATYFKFDEAKIESLFAGAKDLGMELFLLDDGWFGSKYPRDGDHQGLGDWMPDPKKLPHGLSRLTDAAKELGLRFGLWFEPEMVNPGSELCERHPDWLIQQPGRAYEPQRNQMILDLANPEVRDFAYNVLHETLSQYPGISFVKWDCNRYVTQPGSPYLPANRQSHLQIEYAKALDHIMDRLKEDHPEVEVMMCSGGGGRVDYRSMRCAHEVWPSDMTDPVRRIFIQWGYSHFFPAMALANHVTRWGERPLKFCFDVAMSGSLGMDVDVAQLSESDRCFAKSAIETYKRIRDVVQFGELYRLESPYDGARCSLLFRLGERAILFVYASTAVAASDLALRGLDEGQSYRVKEINTADGNGPEATLDFRHILALPEYVELTSSVFEITPI
ncbi:MAG: alpha-galactosidase [Armatimonadetes bacterium]|nr:alpha-galactosidase [Armatimonadota bacterium]